MCDIVKADDNYKNWITDLKRRYQRSQIKAVSSVNREMLMFYWSIGRDIAMLRAESRWGSSFVTTLSEDLRKAIPNVKGFSKTNLFYMIGFYRLYHMGEKFPQVGGKKGANEKFPQVGGKLETLINDEVNQAGVDIFSIPWGHHKLIMDRCKDNREKML